MTKLERSLIFFILLALVMTPISQASYNTIVTEGLLSFSDVTTSNSSSTKHGLLPKLSNVSTEFLSGTGTFTVPAGSLFRTSGAGFALLPAGPSVGTTVAGSASANTYSAYVQMRAATGNAVYILGVIANQAFTQVTNPRDYIQIAIGTGGAGSETQVGEVKMSFWAQDTAVSIDTNTGNVLMFPFPIAVAASTRIAVKVADDNGVDDWSITLLVIDQANVTSS